MIVDTSAIIAILLKEEGFRIYAEAVDEADMVRLSVGNYVEVGTVIDRRPSPPLGDGFQELIDEVAIIIEPMTEAQARIARVAYRDYGKGSGHPARLNFGDCFAYALARDKMEPLLYKGDDFSHTDVRSALP